MRAFHKTVHDDTTASGFIFLVKICLMLAAQALTAGPTAGRKTRSGAPCTERENMHMCCNRLRQSWVHRHCLKDAPQAAPAQAPQQTALPASQLAQGLHWHLARIADVVTGYMHIADLGMQPVSSLACVINSMQLTRYSANAGDYINALLPSSPDMVPINPDGLAGTPTPEVAATDTGRHTVHLSYITLVLCSIRSQPTTQCV